MEEQIHGADRNVLQIGALPLAVGVRQMGREHVGQAVEPSGLQIFQGLRQGLPVSRQRSQAGEDQRMAAAHFEQAERQLAAFFIAPGQPAQGFVPLEEEHRFRHRQRTERQPEHVPGARRARPAGGAR